MLKGLRQILTTFGVLILALFVPLLTESASIRSRQKPEITLVSVKDSAVLGESISCSIPDCQKRPSKIYGANTIQKVGLYTLAFLFIMSIVSFVKYKVIKDINERK